MAFGIEDLKDEIKKMRRIIDNLFTQDFKRKLNVFLDNINQITGNPEFQKNIAGIMAQLQEVLNTVNNTEIIEHADDLVKRVKQILDSIEDEKIAALFSDIAALVHRAVEMDLVGKLSQTLDTVHSMSGLIKFATELGHYGGILMIPWAAPLSKTIKSFINYYLCEEEKSNLQRLLETAREQLYMSIIQVGATSDTNRLVGFIVKCKPIHATSATAASSVSMTYNLASLDNNKADIQHLKKPRHDEEKCDLLEMPTYKDLLKDQEKVQEFAKAYGIVLSDGKNLQLPVPIGGSLVTGISGFFSASSSLQFQNNQPSCDEEKVAYENFGDFSL